MKPIIEFDECLRDSPKFRIAIEVAEADIDQLELKLEKLVKLCTTMVEAGKVYMNTKVQFINGIWDLIAYFRDDALNTTSLQKLIQTLQEMDKYQSILLDQAKRTICKNLSEFMHTDIKKTKDTKRSFEKCSDEYDQALIRNSQAPKSKQHECEEANNVVAVARSGYQHIALNYVFQINMLQAKKRHEVLDTLLSYARAHSTFFHQGSDLCQDIDPFMKQLGQNLAKVRDDTDTLEKSMDGRHSMVGTVDVVQKSVSDCQQEGYLFKRTSNTFKTWKRRWFAIKNHQLVYCKRSKDTAFTVMEEDLRLCTVKPVIDIDRRFCFEVLSPSKSHVLQADSEEMYNKWVTSLQFGIDAALHYTLHGSKVEGKSNSNREISEQQKDGEGPQAPESEATKHVISTTSLWEELSSIAGNDKCCDCSSPNPQWASINLGITLCIECSGIHRSLGVHYSKVRSLRLDDWDPELVKIMKELGNAFINKIYEADVNEKIAERPTAFSSSSVREAWIRTKYVQKAFLSKPVHRLKLHLSRQPNIRFSAHPRRSNDTNKVDSQRLIDKSGEKEKNGKNIDAASNTDSGTVFNDSDKSSEVDLPGEMRREKKYSIGTSPDFHFKRAAGYFGTTSESVPTVLSDRMTVTTLPSVIPPATVEPSLPKRSCSLDESVRSTKNSSREKLGSLSTPVSSAKGEDLSYLDEIKELADFGKAATESDEDWEECSDEDDDMDSNLLLYRASNRADIRRMCVALARGADVSWVNDDDEHQTPVHQAIVSGSILACEYLFLNGAKMDSRDSLGRTPLHLASDLGLTGQVCLLLKRGADQKVKDKDDKDALHYAINNANADIVTLLRLGRLNEEMKENEFGSSDETFNEVVRDFSQRASRRTEAKQRPSVGSAGSS